MIRSIKHRGLGHLYERGDRSGIGANMRDRVERVLFVLDQAENLDDLDLPGYRLHPLTGDRRGIWSIRVTGGSRLRLLMAMCSMLTWRTIIRSEYRMAMKNPPHPGGVVKDCIEDLGLSVTEAASILGVARPTLSRIINGRSAISPEMALRLSMAFGSAPEMWLRLQSAYDLAQTRLHADTINDERYEPVQAFH